MDLFRLRTATAVAGGLMGINPFDEANVQEAKDATNAVLADPNVHVPAGIAPDEAARRLIEMAKPGGYLAILAYVGLRERLAWPYYAGLAVAAAMMGYHYALIRGRTRDGCFKAFLHNNWVGGAIFAGILAAYALAGAWPAGGEAQTVNSMQSSATSPFTVRP